MIDFLPVETVAIPSRYQTASLIDILDRAWGPIGPAIYFLTERIDHLVPNMDQMENIPGRT